MSPDVKRFIEKNISFIEHEAFDEVYEQAYEWLSDDQCKELTNILDDVFENVYFKDIAMSVAAAHVEAELNSMFADKNSLLSLPSLIRLYMNHTCGVDYYELRDHLIANPPYHPLIKQQVDSEGELYFQRAKKI